MPPTRTASTPKTTPRRVGAQRPRPAAATPRRTPATTIRRRKPEPQSNAKKVVGAVTSALPGLLEKAATPAKKAKPPKSKKGAGVALGLAGAGFAAYKQRSKKNATESQVVAPASPTTPVTPVTSHNGVSEIPVTPPTDTPAA